MPVASDERLADLELQLVSNARRISALKVRMLDRKSVGEQLADVEFLLSVYKSRRTALEKESRAIFAIFSSRLVLDRTRSLQRIGAGLVTRETVLGL